MRRQRHTHLFTWATLYHFTLFYQRSLFWDCHSFYMKSSGTPWYRFYGDRPSFVRFMTVVFRLWDFVREGGSCHIGPTCSLVGGSPEVWYTVINRLSRRVPLDRHDWFPWSAEPVRYGTVPSCQLNQWDPPAPRGVGRTLYQQLPPLRSYSTEPSEEQHAPIHCWPRRPPGLPDLGVHSMGGDLVEPGWASPCGERRTGDDTSSAPPWDQEDQDQDQGQEEDTGSTGRGQDFGPSGPCTGNRSSSGPSGLFTRRRRRLEDPKQGQASKVPGHQPSYPAWQTS